MSIRQVAVVDIGKTNAKVALVDLETVAETEVRRKPNNVLDAPPYPHFDVDGLWAFVLESLSVLNRQTPIDAISITAHGATAALIDQKGQLALPILDYEHDGPQSLAASYEAVRPGFLETGSPRLPVGLNLGAQIFWQQTAFPDAFRKTRAILSYPQYWAFRLTGERANEASSLGCHTDLWNPGSGDFSSLVQNQGWLGLMAPIRRADEVLGAILPEVEEATGLARGTPVFCGLHDSNASLLPHLLGRTPPFSVVSTGTWVIAMSVGGKKIALDETRDTLINVNAFGDPVPSARFMGGRAFEHEIGAEPVVPTGADIERVLTEQIMLAPSVNPGSGPFPDRKAHWVNALPASPAEHYVAMCFYLALMTATCLELIGADGPIIVEGPFAGNTLLLDMLQITAGRSVEVGGPSATGTSIGAALLARGRMMSSPKRSSSRTSQLGDAAHQYARNWISEAHQAKDRSGR